MQRTRSQSPRVVRATRKGLQCARVLLALAEICGRLERLQASREMKSACREVGRRLKRMAEREPFRRGGK